tara:strand:- start:252 stop:644 length:393 start_codon:yes stop_codon:yes gene_type:complete
MKDRLKTIFFRLFTLIFIMFSILIFFQTESLFAAESSDDKLINKVSQSYTKKFCNAIGFGLSKESAMEFSLEENKQVFKKKKGFHDINKELLAEEIALSVIEKCGYPINLSGEKGILEFKNYYLSKDTKT